MPMQALPSLKVLIEAMQDSKDYLISYEGKTLTKLFYFFINNLFSPTISIRY